MIKIENKGTQIVKTGKNVSSTAETFFESGPKDALSSQDIYEPNRGNAGGGSGGSGTRPTGGSVLSNRNGDSASNGGSSGGDGSSRARTVAEMAGDNLWQAIICGAPDEPTESNTNRLSRMNNTAAWLRELGCNAEDIAGLLAVEGGTPGLDEQEIENRLDGAKRQTLRQMSDQAKDNIVKDLAERSGGSQEDIRIIIDGEAQRVANGDYDSAQDIASLLSGTAQALDVGAESSVIGQILDQSIAMGVPEATDQIIQEFSDDRSRRKQLLRRVRQSAINSNLHFIRRAVEIEGAESIRAREPNLITLITQYYTLRGAERNQYADKRQELLNTLEMVDPNWYRTKRNGVWVSDLTAFSSASDDALTLLKGSEEHRVAAMMGQSYREQSIFSAARMYNEQVALTQY